MVEDPGILEDQAGRFHLIWTCASLSDGLGPFNLNHTIFNSSLSSWETPNIVVEESAIWSRIVEDGGGLIHLVWVEAQPNRMRTRHSVYRAESNTWTDPSVVFSEPVQAIRTALSVDHAGNMHIVQLSSLEGDSMVQHKTWNGQAWSTKDSFSPHLVGPATALDTRITAEGDLIAIYMGTGEAVSTDGPQERLVITQTGVGGESETSERLSQDGPGQSVEQDQDAPTLSLQEGVSQENNGNEVEQTMAARPVVDTPSGSFPGLAIGAVAALVVVVVILVQRLRPN
jgi:hypothetical protein